MYKINVSSHFSSAHNLRGYPGLCKNVHGHNWKVRIALLCEKTDELGMAVDFTVAKRWLDDLMEEFDHKHLNTLEPFLTVNPTSENIAKYLYNRLKGMIDVEGCQISEIEVWEAEKSSVVYFE
ncbi:MAG: 6-carboxytetrahydropterin synthase QueD [Candidatus Cloacimonetes bacterium 4572_65]|nr:MAG: 6-carboxytetrahydropterin synthase QueD [Candidatus Cloacimonetes bacterium 4572_65]